MTEITDRQQFLLSLVIHEYVRSASPVGSKHVVDEYHLDMSSATVRNEMAVLTEMGYLRQPHLSAGRVPTEDGYRLFVSHMVQRNRIAGFNPTHDYPPVLSDATGCRRLDASGSLRPCASISFRLTRYRSSPRRIAIQAPGAHCSPGTSSVDGIGIDGGEILQRFISLAEPVPQELLSSTADRLNSLYTGKKILEITSDTTPLTRLNRTFCARLLKRWGRRMPWFQAK